MTPARGLTEAHGQGRAGGRGRRGTSGRGRGSGLSSAAALNLSGCTRPGAALDQSLGGIPGRIRRPVSRAVAVEDSDVRVTESRVRVSVTVASVPAAAARAAGPARQSPTRCTEVPRKVPPVPRRRGRRHRDRDSLGPGHWQGRRPRAAGRAHCHEATAVSQVTVLSRRLESSAGVRR